MMKIYKPTGNLPGSYQYYIDLVPNDGNLIEHLKKIHTETAELIAGLSEEQLLYRYSEGKWTIKDILVHLADCERISSYRALRIARGDKTDLPGFDEVLFAEHTNANNRAIGDIMKELESLRTANIIFITTLDEEALDRTGTADDQPMSTRLLVNHIYGHQRHHLNIIKERYLTKGI